MNQARPVIDAHVHLGPVGRFYTPRSGLEDLLKIMDRLGIGHAVCSDHLSLFGGTGAGLADAGLRAARRLHEESGGRVHFLIVYDPRRRDECLRVLAEATGWRGFAGIKIHPSFHGVPAEDEGYDPLWRFADERSISVLTHSWSLSDYNPDQALSLPSRFEKYVKKYRQARIVLAHAGGRGNGREELLRLVQENKNAYTDIAGDVFCHRLVESLTRDLPPGRVLFGSDFPWFDPAANLSRVFLSGIDEREKERILRENALAVYRL
jgi:predicted TIM-barrel fold metal-dependent hydrolase